MNKRDLLREKVKTLIFNGEGVSRKDVSRYLGIDTRTVASCIDALLEAGMARGEIRESKTKGRPLTLYYPDFEKICFAGFHLSAKAVETILIDYHGKLLDMDTMRIDMDNESRLSLINRLLEKLRKYRNNQRCENLCGIGIALSRWLSPPIAASEMYSGISEIIERDTGVPVFREIPVNAATYHVRWVFPELKNICVVHPGHILELGVQADGLVLENASECEYNFSHCPVKDDGIKCYCGKRGCLENYLSRGALAEMMKKECKKDLDFREACAGKEKKALELGSICGEMLGLALQKTSPVNRSEIIVFLEAPGIISEKAVAFMKKNQAARQIRFLEIDKINIALAAAEMAVFRTVKNYIRAKI